MSRVGHDSNSQQVSRADRVRPLRGLIKRFPDEPAPYAAFLRYYPNASGILIGGNRRDYYALEAPIPGAGLTPPGTTENARTRPAALKDVEWAAVRGHALDPENAFFPMMLAYCFYGEYRDTEGDRQMLIAGRCMKYDDYIQREMRGAQKSCGAYGEPGMVQRTNAWADVLYPHLAGLRNLSRMTTFSAMKSEIRGDVRHGVDLRMSVIHCGSLMRAQSPILISNLVGIAVASTAAYRPGGAPAISNSAPPDAAGSDLERLEKQRQSRHRARLISYLKAQGFEREAASAQQEYKACDNVRSIVKRSPSGALNQVIIPPMLTWSISCLILAVTAFLGILWIVAAVLARVPVIRERRRLLPGVAWAILISIPLAFFQALVSVDHVEFGMYSIPLLFIAVIWVGAYLMKWQTIARFSKTLAISTLALTLILLFVSGGVRSYPPVLQFWQVIQNLSGA